MNEETTERIRAERQLGMLRDLAAQAALGATPEDACMRAARVLGENPAEAAFALLFLVDKGDPRPRQVASAGFEGGAPKDSADALSLDSHQSWPLGVVLRTRAPATVDDVRQRVGGGAAPRGRPSDAAEQAICLPLAGPCEATPYGVLVVGLSRPLDERYRAFLEQVADEVTGALARIEVRRLRERVARERSNLADFEVLAKAAEEANCAKDEFLAILGHELRNPLSPIVTALQVMRLRGDRSREQDIIERQVGYLIRLVDDLLDMSRIKRGKLELRKQNVELADIIVQAIETVSPLLEQRHNRVEVDVPRRGLVVNADPVRLAQVFSNLLTNAAKYSEEESRIEVRAERIGDKVCLRVKDEGVGIDADMMEKVFGRFVQQPQTLDRSRGGLGLGLAIVKSLVEMHGGRVCVHSEGPGKGSEFTVELPAVERDRRADEKPLPPTSKKHEARGTRVLVVDDNADAAELLKDALERLGYAVEVANNGPSALELAKSFHPEVALLDIGLPVMDGYELAQRLDEECEQGQELHLVAVTGYGQPTDRERAVAAGFERHLVKPVDLAKLARVVHELSHPA